MEAIGLVASIITLISAASHATSVLERVLGLRGISLYVLGAINEVSDFKATLTLVQTTLEETQHQLPLDHRVEYTRLLDRAMGCMNAFTKYLQKHVLRDREQVACVGKAMELKRRMKWTEVLGGGQTQCQINAFQQELASLKLSFVLSTPAQIFSAKNLNGQLCELFRNRPDVVDARDTLDLAPATRLILEERIVSLSDLLRIQPSAALARDTLGKTPLHWAVILGNAEAIDLLVAAGADLNAVSKDHKTILWNAVRSKFSSRSICIKILEAGADVNQVIQHTFTALGVAVSSSRVSMTDILLKAGADVDGAQSGHPALTIAASTSAPEVLEHLLSAGANIEARNPLGKTAVICAAQYNNHAALEILIQHGARLNGWTNSHHSIIHFVASYGDLKTMQTLEKACIEGLPMDEDSLEDYWYHFEDRRCNKYLPKAKMSREVEEAAFQGLLDSIVPAEYATSEDEHYEDSDAIRIPGAFPVDPDGSDCETRIAEAREKDADYECEEEKDSDDESWITTDDCSGDEEDTNAVTDDDEDGDLT
ncbi:uncharacterized protein J4E87_008868 [Alternaria ethzedia]|uniref:uncharacterized protein n=1 Tax=Alternaria ethzedia TaxID=181014 RepID=UPI0020C44D97|nr:uncharacterized protein J4E87_008868 [Alternaria ethzedia]KAI4616133.1 hypothetical protein J4E87_008868 [Alternaria ethzedia]